MARISNRQNHSTMEKATKMKTLSKPRQFRARFGIPVLYEAFGVRFAVRVMPRFEAQLRTLLPVGSVQLDGDEVEGDVRFSVRRRPDGNHFRLLCGSRVLIETRSVRRVLSALRGALVNHVGRRVKNRIFVHAGAVSWKGRAILLPGDSYAGKSTLVAALLKMGATYYSDEIAVLDEEGHLHAYPRDLQLRNEFNFQERRTVAQIAGKKTPIGTEAVRVGAIVFAAYVESKSWKVEELSPGIAAMRGMRHTLTLKDDPARTMQTWAKVMEEAIAWKWERGDAKLAAKKLLQAIETMTIPA
jgi:hypothetical protein